MTELSSTARHDNLDRRGAAPAVVLQVLPGEPKPARDSSRHSKFNMFITPLFQQHTSHTLASRVYGPQPHMRS